MRDPASHAAYMRGYWSRNRERLNAARKARGVNREKANARNRRYQQTERGRLIGVRKAHAYRARYNGVVDAEWLAALRSDPCSYCGGVGGEVDHIDPLSRGGLNVWDNLTAACRSCNASKGDRTILEALDA